MMKSGIDQQALIDLFANASAQQTAQLREAVFKSTLGALQGRELSLKNIRSVLEKLNLSGTQTGLKASGAAEQLTAQMEQMQSAMRASRAAGLRAAQTLAESYTALVSGVLIGMSDAMRQAAVPAKKSAKK
jgi:hypothetical protein